MRKGNRYATFQATDEYTFVRPIWVKSLLICPGAAALTPFTFSLAFDSTPQYPTSDAGLVPAGSVNYPKEFIEITLGVSDGKAIHYPVNIRNTARLLIEAGDPFSIVMEYVYEDEAE